MSPTAVAIRTIDAVEAQARLHQLADILVDTVANGASVNFMAGFGHAGACDFWRGQLSGLKAGDRQLLVADDGGRLVGTALLFFAPQPNQPHRADVGKMLVLSSLRRRGVARQLLDAVEVAARLAGRTLLMLDTETGSGAEHLYATTGWTAYGTVPGHALRPNGEPASTTFFFKRLG